jgi:hypothetical protein
VAAQLAASQEGLSKLAGIAACLDFVHLIIF